MMKSPVPRTGEDDTPDLSPPTVAMQSIFNRVLSPVELCVQKGMDVMDKLCSLFDRDAMYIITGYIEPLLNYGQPKQDCMDVLVETGLDAMERITGYIEPGTRYGQPKHDGISALVEKEVLYALVNPVVGLQLKNCTVRLEKINDILSFVPKKDACNVVLNMGRPHTRSQCTPKPSRTQRYPRRAHQQVNYLEKDVASEDEPLQKRLKTHPVGSIPSEDRINV